jgi:hypothetical protein
MHAHDDPAGSHGRLGGSSRTAGAVSKASRVTALIRTRWLYDVPLLVSTGRIAVWASVLTLEAVSCRRPRREPRPPSRADPGRFPERQLSIPRSSRRRSPEAPAGPRRTPQDDGWKALLAPVIPADSRPDRRDQDRPVTPEVAGSSPVAPVTVYAASAATFPVATPEGGKTIRRQHGRVVSGSTANESVFAREYSRSTTTTHP